MPTPELKLYPGLDFFGMAIKLDATVCLHKPFTPRQLIAVVNAGLGLGLLGDRPPRIREIGQGS
jgi:hypothetical protein